MFSFRITIFASIFAAGILFATAQDVPIPIGPCVDACLVNATSPDSCASVTDTQCICTSQAYMDAVRECALSTPCPQSEIDALLAQQAVTCAPFNSKRMLGAKFVGI